MLLICSLFITVSATGTVPGVYSPTGGDSSGRAIVPPDDSGLGDGKLLFTMYATEVRTFLKSDGNFVPILLGDDIESIFYSGRVYSSNVANGGNCRIYVGIGYYEPREYIFTVIHSIEILMEDHGMYFGSDQTRIDISEFDPETVYYAFIENDFPSGGTAYAWGEVSVFASRLSD